MIYPFYKHENKAEIIEVEDYGIINLNNLPIRMRRGIKGYELLWCITSLPNGEEAEVLSVIGSFEVIGRALKVIKIIK